MDVDIERRSQPGAAECGLAGHVSAWFGWSAPGWLGAAEWAKPALILLGLWGAGSGMILWLAGLQGIGVHLYEAANLDGAGAWAKFRHVTLPMLSPYIFFNLIMGTISALQEFDGPYVLTGGDPSKPRPGGQSAPARHVPVQERLPVFQDGLRFRSRLDFLCHHSRSNYMQLKLASKWVYYESDK